MRPTLQELAVKHVCERAWTHSYLPDYDEVLSHLRDQPITLLEIGIGIGLWQTTALDGSPLPDGAGLAMWHEYFPDGMILGLDCLPCTLSPRERVSVLPTCHQADPRIVDVVRAAAPAGLDVVIDDASHNHMDQVASYNLLRPLLKPGAFYFVEDIRSPCEVPLWQAMPGYVRHWARYQQGPGGPHRADDCLVMLRG